MPRAQIIDYGMGNLGSLTRSLEVCGADVSVVKKASHLKASGAMILPGVGAFSEGMGRLHSEGWVSTIRNFCLEQKIPILGICLGMQLLAEKGTEGGETPGLGVIPGEVLRLEMDQPSTRIPHVGWNEVRPSSVHPLFDQIESGTDFYFVHSYRFVPKKSEDVLSLTPYCGQFVSAVHRENIVGVQYHPEKSQKPGLQFLRNFLRSVNTC